MTAPAPTAPPDAAKAALDAAVGGEEAPLHGEGVPVPHPAEPPDAQGRGYARALMGRVINRMLRAGETPFLHVESKNLRAIDLYVKAGNRALPATSS